MSGSFHGEDIDDVDVKSKRTDDAPAPSLRRKSSCTVMAIAASAEPDTTTDSTTSEDMKLRIAEEDWSSDFAFEHKVSRAVSPLRIYSHGGIKLGEVDTITKNQRGEETWESDFVLEDEAALIKSTVRLQLGQGMEDFESMTENRDGTQKWDSDYLLENEEVLLTGSNLHLPLGQGMDNFEMMETNRDGKEKWDSDFDLGDEEALHNGFAFRVYTHGGKQLGEVDMMRKNSEGKEEWDEDFVLGEENIQLNLRGEQRGRVQLNREERAEHVDAQLRLLGGQELQGDQEVRLHLRGGQGDEDVDMDEEESAAPTNPVARGGNLHEIFRLFSINDGSSSADSSDMPYSSGYTLQPSLVHPSGFKAVRQKNTSDLTASQSENFDFLKAEMTKMLKQNGPRGCSESSTDKDISDMFSAVKERVRAHNRDSGESKIHGNGAYGNGALDMSALTASMVHPSGVKRVRARSEGPEESKKRRKGGAGASVDGDGALDMADDAMDMD